MSSLISSVFITGIAGFIGFHLASSLVRQNVKVFGIDNFHPYYDPRLKRRRAQILRDLGVDVIEKDLLEVGACRRLLEKEGILHVVHLAAQAGVRHALQAPQEYVRANIQGSIALFELLATMPGSRLVYASSSSVYGGNTSIPFAEHHATERPTNVYGMTKKAGELMAYTYHHLYQLPSIGLRFFTVYGPWGRPDMAYYHFARSILEGKPLLLHHEGRMKRDFTYIDDIVDGIERALVADFRLDLCNLGHDRPYSVLQLVELLEMRLGRKAKIELGPMQPGEVLSTHADLTYSRTRLGYSPRISLEEGIGHFVDWLICEGSSFVGS